MIEYITFPKELYLGVNGDLSTEDPKLGFATPVGTDKAYEKRKATVDAWVRPTTVVYGKTPEGFHDYSNKTVVPVPHYKGIIANDPQKGFALGKTVSRYSTSNKWFEVIDPRGFKLQISSYNLEEICKEGAIIKGVLQGEYIWSRDKANMYLMSTASEEYQASLVPKTQRDIVVGDIVKHKTKGDNLTYLGRFFLRCYEVVESSRWPYTGRGGWTGTEYQYTRTPRTWDVEKPYHIFMEKDGKLITLITMSDLDKKSFDITGKAEVMPDFVLDKPYSSEISYRFLSNSYPDTVTFHATKEDRKNSKFTLDAFKAIWKTKFLETATDQYNRDLSVYNTRKAR